MSERDDATGIGSVERTDPLLERRGRDGDAGAGDTLGGLGAGVGDRLGDDGSDEPGAYEPGPVSGHQHDLDAAEPRTDSATTVHSVTNLPAEGA